MTGEFCHLRPVTCMKGPLLGKNLLVFEENKSEEDVLGGESRPQIRMRLWIRGCPCLEWIACQTVWAWAAAADSGLRGMLAEEDGLSTKGTTGHSKSLWRSKCHLVIGRRVVPNAQTAILVFHLRWVTQWRSALSLVRIEQWFLAAGHVWTLNKVSHFTFYAVPFVSGSASIMEHL